ncbi:TetR/AcrR family transcriptional regulator [Conexibacter sp. SYSU D00693]|uniref:TetR/AcrR family transcriptional regulator n=1 Tax=Conexibacter sp. SYSU D00693 TaxID=2812560 RepID=UPI00196B05AA|nr:TetR/AcrR family transcriptional regulator [Conexibacter sp. SYSU D00693]
MPSEGLAQDDRRTTLLRAARDLLAEQGYDGTTVSHVAKRAGVAQGTFYLYFETKGDLLDAFAQQVGTELADAIREPLRDDAEVDTCVRGAVQAAVETGRRNQDILAIANHGLEIASHDRYVALTAPVVDEVEAFLRRRQEAGDVDRDLEPAVTARVARDVLDRCMKAEVLHGDVGYADAVADLALRALVSA